MNRYLKLFLAFLALSLKRFLEHRSNTFGNLSLSLIGIFLVILFIEIIFSQTPLIQGWSKYELLFLVGFYRIVFNIFYVFFIKSIDMFPGYIKTGELDMLLTKPVNSQFFVSFRHARIYELGQLIPSLFLLGYAIINLELGISYETLFLYLIGTLTGLTIIYCLYFALATLAIWLIDMEAMVEFQYATSQISSYPVDIFGRTAGMLLTYIIPIAFVVTFPVKVLLDKTSEVYILFGVILAVTLFVITNWFWNFALKHYTSASS